MKLKISLILIAVMLGLSAGALAEVQLSAKVDKSRVTVGEIINYSLSLEYEPGSDFSPPKPEEFSFEPFKVKDYAVTPQLDQGGKKVLQYVFQLAIYELGSFSIPPAEVEFKTGEGQPAFAKSNLILIEVVSVPPKAEDQSETIRPQKDPQEVKPPFWYYLLAVLLLLILALLIRLLIKRIKHKQKEELKKGLPPHQLALEALSQLKSEDLPGRGEWKAYYSRLSGILRAYLEARFSLAALESTTWELVRSMRKAQLPEQIVELSGEVLSLADLVKFAKHIPDLTDCAQDLERSFKLIESTIPAEPENQKAGVQP